MEFTKINKTKARNLYNQGVSIYIVPCKVWPSHSNVWMKPFELQYTGEMRQCDLDYPTLAYQHKFDSRVNNFEYYNCNYELGYYTAYYIKQD